MPTKLNKSESDKPPRSRRVNDLESLSALRAGSRRRPRPKAVQDGGFEKMVERAMETL